MDKKEIKKDVILEKILNFLNLITDNIKQTSIYISIFIFLVITYVVYSNNNQAKQLSYNAYSSANQNNYIDDSKDLAILGFDNILNTYDTSESYNQALLYLISDALDNNDYTLLGELLHKNKFSTEDPTLNTFFESFKANYYVHENDLDNAITSYNKAIEFSGSINLTNRIKLNLIYIYLKKDNIDKVKKLFSEIDTNDLSYDLKNKFDEIESRLSYQSN